MSAMKIAILDDYQDVALSLADWSSLDGHIEVFTAPFPDPNKVVERLGDFDVLVAIRGGHRFPPICCPVCRASSCWSALDSQPGDRREGGPRARHSGHEHSLLLLSDS